MRVKCTTNSKKDLADYEYSSLKKGKFGRFNISNEGEYPVIIGNEYLVVGMIMFQNYLAYLIDESGLIFTAPCYLFVVTDPEINSRWYFRMTNKEENIYPFIQAIWGYKELCSEKQSYEDLIVEMKDEAQGIYYRRKAELSDY